MMVAPASRRAH